MRDICKPNSGEFSVMCGVGGVTNCCNGTGLSET